MFILLSKFIIAKFKLKIKTGCGKKTFYLNTFKNRLMNKISTETIL